MADPFDGLDAVEPGVDPFAGLDELDAEGLPAGSPLLRHDVDAPRLAPSGPAPGPQPGPAEETVEPARTGGLEAFGRGAAQGASMGLADEAGGVGAGVAALMDDTRGGSFRDRLNAAISAYTGQRDSERAANRKAAADTAFDKTGMNPVLDALTPDSVFGAGELTGGVATAAAPIGKAGEGLKLAQRIKAASKAGAGLGAVAGYGAGEGDLVDQAVSTGAGAAGGAILAPAAAEGARLLGKGAGATSKALRARLDRLRGGPDAREVMYGSPEAARTAEQLADPVAGKAQRAQAAAGADEQAIEARARDVGGKIDELWRHSDVVKWEEDIASKGNLVKQLVSREQVPGQGLAQADDAYNAVRAEFDQLAADAGKGAEGATIRRLQRTAFEAYENRLKKAADNFDPADPSGYVGERFMALDDLKRQLQKEIARPGGAPGELFRLRDMAEGLRGNLEDPAVWGAGPATLQKVRNRGWARRLQASGSPEDAFLSSRHFGEASADPYRTAAEHDPAKVLGMVRGAGKMEGEAGSRALVDWAEREAGLLESLTARPHGGDVDPDLVARATRARALATEIKQAMSGRADEAKAAEALQRAAGAEPPPSGAIRTALESTPTIGPLVQRLRGPTHGQRAARMSELERVLRDNPSNEAARAELQSLVPGGTSEALGESAARGGMRSAATGGGGRAPAYGASVVTARRSDDAQDDPRWGQLISSTPAGPKRDATYATLVHQDPEFRARERERANQQEESTP